MTEFCTIEELSIIIIICRLCKVGTRQRWRRHFVFEKSQQLPNVESSYVSVLIRHHISYFISENRLLK